MAVVHPDDLAFVAGDPVSIKQISALFSAQLGIPVDASHVSSPTSTQGQYHKIYFVALPQPPSLAGTFDQAWAGRDVVLRIARKAFPHVKVENEVAAFEVARRGGIPVPEILFFSSNTDAVDNLLGYEYICMECVKYPSLIDTWHTFSDEILTHVLEQFVDFHVKTFKLETGDGNYGSIYLESVSGKVRSGPILEETEWQTSDIGRFVHATPYDLTAETAQTLNPSAPHGYANFPAYVAAFLKSYAHLISIHPSAAFLAHLVPALGAAVEKLEAAGSTAEDWVLSLREEPGLRGYLWHRDLHFGNIMVDPATGTFKSILDWEFAGVGPCFTAKTTDPLRGALYQLHQIPASDSMHERARSIVDSWPVRFAALLEARDPVVAAAWRHNSDEEQVLGAKGKALSTLREYLRSCLEVAVRGWGNLDTAKAQWLPVVEESLKELGVNVRSR